MSSNANPRDRMLARAARDIRAGMVVNLGIGLPTQVLRHVPADLAVCLHSENGISGVGPVRAKGSEDRNLIDAGGAYVSTLPGAAFFDSADFMSTCIRKCTPPRRSRPRYIGSACSRASQVGERGSRFSATM